MTKHGWKIAGWISGGTAVAAGGVALLMAQSKKTPTVTTTLGSVGTITPSATASTITLGWQAVTGATSYTVKQNTPDTSVVQYMAGTTSATLPIAKMTPGTAYTVSVQACAQGTCDKPSTVTVTVPVSVSGVQVTTHSTSLVLSWNKSAGADSYTVTNLATGTTVAKNITGTSYTMTGLTTGQTYHIGVSACNSLLCQATPTAISATPASSTPSVGIGNVPGYMGSSLGFKLNSNTSTTLAWHAASGATYYKILLPSGTLVATVTGTSYQLSGLTPGQSYTYRVLPCNTNGCNLNQAPITWTQPNTVTTGTNPVYGNKSQIDTYTASNGQTVTVASTEPNGSQVVPTQSEVNDFGAIQQAASSGTSTSQAFQNAQQIQSLQSEIANDQNVLAGLKVNAAQSTGSERQMYLNSAANLQSWVNTLQAQLAALQG